jgi:hypothetical protein
MAGTAICILPTVVSKEGNSLVIIFLQERKLTVPIKIIINARLDFFISDFKDRIKTSDALETL